MYVMIQLFIFEKTLLHSVLLQILFFYERMHMIVFMFQFSHQTILSVFFLAAARNHARNPLL